VRPDGHSIRPHDLWRPPSAPLASKTYLRDQITIALEACRDRPEAQLILITQPVL
jgi:hypothetical protein